MVIAASAFESEAIIGFSALPVLFGILHQNFWARAKSGLKKINRKNIFCGNFFRQILFLQPNNNFTVLKKLFYGPKIIF